MVFHFHNIDQGQTYLLGEIKHPLRRKRGDNAGEMVMNWDELARLFFFWDKHVPTIEGIFPYWNSSILLLIYQML